MILKGASGKDAELPINLFNEAGEPLEDHVWVTGEVLLALPNGTFEDANVANIFQRGRGRYALRLTAFETSTTGSVQLDLDTTNGYLPHSVSDQIHDIGSPVVASLMAFSHRSGRTVLGFFRRMDSLFFGKVTGLRSPNVTGYQPGSTTLVEFTTLQDTAGGNKSESVVTNSETP